MNLIGYIKFPVLHDIGAQLPPSFGVKWTNASDGTKSISAMASLVIAYVSKWRNDN